MITGSLGQHKQDSPLLERLDWFLASPSWMVSYPGFSVKTLSRDISDHNPCTLIFQRQKLLDLKITGCYMMTSCRSWNMDGIYLMIWWIKQNE
jgi:hypothetical protein